MKKALWHVFGCAASSALLALAVPAHGTEAKITGAELRKRPERPIAQIVVRFRDESAATHREGIASTRMRSLTRRAETGLQYRRPMSGLAHVMRLDRPLPRAEAVAVVERLRRDPGVAYAEIDEYVYPQFSPNDPFFNDPRELQWHLKAPSDARRGGVNLPTAWDRSRGAGVVVAVIDTGIFNHPDLEANVIRGYDFISADAGSNPATFLVANDGDGRDPDPSDPGDWIDAGDRTSDVFTGCDVTGSSWHGTHVAGTIAARTNNSDGVAGVAFDSKVLVVRALGKCFGYGSDITDAIRWAAGVAPSPTTTWPQMGIPNNTTPARVINLSLGSEAGSACPFSRQAAINDARAAGAVVVAATGNDGAEAIGSPANCSGVIAVTAHTIEGDSADYANVGPGTAISAPGGGDCTTTSLNCLPNGSSGAPGTIWRFVTSTISDGARGPGDPAYAGFAGTSQATPHVAGIAALLVSAAPGITPDAARSILTGSARPFPAATYCTAFADGRCGAGMVDAAAALQRLTDLTPTAAAQANAAVVANGSTATLTGVATPKPAGSTTFTYRWDQTAGPAVSLQSPLAAQTAFTAPTPGAQLSFRFTATDANGLSATATVDVRSNGAPTVNPVAAQSVVAGNALTFRVTATDPENDALTFVATGVPAGATFSAATGDFSWPSAGPPGSYAFTVRATDGAFSSADVPVSITVEPAPTSSSDGGGGALPLWQILMLIALGLARRVRLRD